MNECSPNLLLKHIFQQKISKIQWGLQNFNFLIGTG